MDDSRVDDSRVNEELRRTSAHVFVSSLDAPVLESDDVHHLLRVLRLRDGEVVSATDGTGGWRLCRLVADGQLRTEGDVRRTPATSPSITVGFALPKGDRPEWIVQKLTEVGVDRIVLLHADRSVVRWDAVKAAKHLGRLSRIAREAAMQSRRVRAVDLAGPIDVATMVSSGVGGVDPVGIAMAEPGGARLDLDRPTVLIGPEGGWSDDELALVSSRVSLGSTVLRVETAALAAGVRLAAMREAVTR